MSNNAHVLPPGEHPYDPRNRDVDPVAFALHRVQTLLVWIEEHRATLQKALLTDTETVENELSNLRAATRDAMIYLERLSELLLAGHVIDHSKRIPDALSGPWFYSCLKQVLAAEESEGRNWRRKEVIEKKRGQEPFLGEEKGSGTFLDETATYRRLWACQDHDEQPRAAWCTTPSTAPMPGRPSSTTTRTMPPSSASSPRPSCGTTCGCWPTASCPTTSTSCSGPATMATSPRFMRWLTVTHTQRWHAHHRTAGTGHLYQGRFKSFPVQSDDHFLAVCRYVERNALRADLVDARRIGDGAAWRRDAGRRTRTGRR